MTAGNSSDDITELKFQRGSTEHAAALEDVAAGTLLAKACGPDDVADAVMSFIVFNRFVTGETLSVTGGSK